MNKKYGLNELREMFLSFFESKEHLRLPSFSLIPQNDNSLLLINSGMAPMKPYFKGEQVPPRQRVCTCQKCIRTGDIENIGKTSRHGTFFEMLGNFSFGDYFKHEAIAWSWEFLTSSDWVGLDPNRLYPSVYVDDEEAFNIWKDEIGIAPNRIFKFGKEDNFWEHGAGPCGPCSEIYYDRGEKYGCGKQNCTVGCDCDRYIEVWNNVFSQFDNDGKNNYSELKQKNIDTGMGLERLAVVCQDVDSLFDVDTVMNITNKVSELTNAYYGKDHKTDVSLRVITDHIRSSVFMICDGILPSNEGRGYVLRRLLRRAARHGKLLGINEPFLYKIVNTVVNESKTQYPELIEKCDYIVSMVKNEEDNFAKTLDAGLAKFSDMLKVSQNGIFSGENAFRLYDTFGFPIDLTIDMCDEIGLHVDEDEFKRLMQEQKERARNARKALGDLGWAGEEFGKDVPETIFVGYNNLSSASKVVAVLNDGKSDSEINDGDSGVIVLDNTPFYATMGGQVSDIGCISTKDSIFTVTKVEKNKGGKYMHFGTLSGSKISVNDSVNCEIDLEYRRSVSRSHDATHLLQAALKTVLGDQVHQAGSLVESDALRFDFTYFKPLTLEEITEVETIVNKFILSAFEINTLEMSLEEAQRTGATALFGEKYGSVVRVVSMGDISKEFCGGTHLDNTSMIGLFKIISEGSIASGVRRITAYTGFNAINSFYENQNKLLSEIDAYNLEIKELKKTIEHYKSKETYDNAEKYLKEIKSINGFDVITKKLDNIDSNTMKNIGDALKEKNKNIILLLASVANDKITYYCGCGDTAVNNGANAGNIIKAVTSITNGKGGGKPDSAMGGGNDLSKLDQSLDVEVFING